MEQNENLANRLGNIIIKLNRVHPDLAVQVVLSFFITDKELLHKQIDCILLIASMREIARNKKQNTKE